MDEMVMNRELSQMMASLTQQRSDLQNKMYGDMEKRRNIMNQMRALKDQLDNVNSDIQEEKQTFEDFEKNILKVQAARKKVLDDQQQMVDELKNTADTLHRSKIGAIGSGKGKGGTGVLPNGQSYDDVMKGFDDAKSKDGSPASSGDSDSSSSKKRPAKITPKKSKKQSFAQDDEQQTEADNMDQDES